MVAIALDVGPLTGPKTGIGSAVEHLISSMSTLDPAPRFTPYVLSFRAELQPGVRRLKLPAAIAHRWWAHASWPRFDRQLGHPDIVHGTNYVVPPTRCPRLVSVYDCWFLEHPDDVTVDVARAGQVLRHSVAEGAVVHVSSEATATRIRRLLDPRRVEVIPLGTIAVPPPPAGFMPNLPLTPSDRFVLSLGTVERRKNIPTLINAFALGCQSLGEVKLVIAGGQGNDSPLVAAAIAALHPAVASQVVVAGRVDEVTKAWLLHHAALLAYPSLDEGFGFPVLEAMDAGVPVVASTAGSIPEVAGDAALLVDAHDDAALGEALERMLTDDETRAKAIVAGRERAAHFDWQTTASRMVRLYDSMLNGHE